MRSEIGIIYLNDFNRKSITKLLHSNGLEFHTLTKCSPFVYLWKGHPLANEKKITFNQLADYPCLSFEQGDNSTFYLAEELLSTADYQRTIKANDRATMLNLMIGLNGYTLCSGIICEELNGSDYIAVPFEDDSNEINFFTVTLPSVSAEMRWYYDPQKKISPCNTSVVHSTAAYTATT